MLAGIVKLQSVHVEGGRGELGNGRVWATVEIVLESPVAVERMGHDRAQGGPDVVLERAEKNWAVRGLAGFFGAGILVPMGRVVRQVKISNGVEWELGELVDPVSHASGDLFPLIERHVLFSLGICHSTLDHVHQNSLVAKGVVGRRVERVDPRDGNRRVLANKAHGRNLGRSLVVREDWEGDAENKGAWLQPAMLLGWLKFVPAGLEDAIVRAFTQD